MLERFLIDLGSEIGACMGAWGGVEETVVGSEHAKLLNGSWMFLQSTDNTVELFLDFVLFYQCSLPES